MVFTLVAEELAEAEAMLNAIKATAALDRGHYGENPDSYGFILPNVEVHTSATGSEASTQVEGCSHVGKSNSERVADCGATPCSVSSGLVRFLAADAVVPS